MAHLYKKVKNGRDYYYIRETQRVYGKPTTINQVYLGTADKVQELLKQEKGRGFSPKEFGSIFVINELNRSVDLPGIVDDILPPKKRTKGPTLGELLFYAAMNRAIAPTSKRQLASWYESTDIQRVRPLRLESLNSQNFWNYWDRISEGDLERMALAFFRQVHSMLPSHQEHLVVEATDIYSPTPQPSRVLLEGGLPRVGLAIVSERFNGVPLFYQAYPGGLPETGFYLFYLDSLLARLPQVGVKAQDFTLIFSQGIESEAVLQRIDSQDHLHFIASYALDFAPELAKIPLKEFRPLPCRLNERRIASGEEDHQILYHETQGVYLNRPRRVIITFDPKVFQKKYQDLRTRVHKLRKELLTLQKHVQHEDRPGLDAQAVEAHLAQVCQRLHLSPSVFSWSITQENGRPSLTFQLEQDQLSKSVLQFGKTILITDREDWDAPEICRTFMERCVIDASDPQAKSSTHVTLMPLYHWTDSKVQVHMFVCVAALTYLALLNQHLMDAGLPLSPREAILEMRGLATAIFLTGIDGKLKRALNSITDTQNAILKALGYQVEEGKVVPL